MNRLIVSKLMLCALCAALPLAGHAEPNAGTPKKNPASSGESPALDARNAAEDKQRRPEARQGDEGHYLRCWQYGRLIFEEAIAAVPPEVISQGTAFRAKPEQRGATYLLDMKSGATCLVK